MKRIILILLLVFTSLNAYSETDPKIYLVTIGPGDDIFLRWGHFAIVIDYKDSKDFLFDYGNFSFSEDDFVENFIKGIMTYFKYRKSANYELGYYKMKNRTITLQELNLTSLQVNLYVNKLQNDIKPENRYYQYDQYYNNCVSQISDFLNELTEGAFYNGTSRLTDRSFRDLSRDYISSNYIYNTIIMFVLGSKVDHNITLKESLFLPDYAMKRADKVMIPDENGGLKPLVKKREVIYESVGRDPVIVNAKPKILINFLVGLILAIISIIIGKIPRLSGIIDITMGVVIGTIGSVLFFMAFFTGHYYIHNNWNLIMVNPITFILLVGGILKLNSKYYKKGVRIITTYIDITLLATVVMLMLKSIGLIQQDNGEIISLIAPILVVNSSFKLLFPYQTGRFRRLFSKPGNSAEASISNSLDESTTVELSSK